MLAEHLGIEGNAKLFVLMCEYLDLVYSPTDKGGAGCTKNLPMKIIISTNHMIHNSG